MKISILVLILSTAIKNNHGTNRPRRMLNADECDIRKHPSLVSITDYNITAGDHNNLYSYGTGILITMRWLLTSSKLIGVDVFRIPSNVLAGANRELAFETGQVRAVKQAHFYGTIKTGYGGYDARNGLVLVELQEPFEKSDRIQPAKIPKKSNLVDECTKLTVVGWGQNSSHEDTFKLMTDIRKANKGDLLTCGKAKHIQKPCVYHPNQICFEMEGRTTFNSEWDEGFGVFCSDTLVGITTTKRGNNATGTVFNITNFMDWMHELAGIEIPSEFYQNITTPAATQKPHTTDLKATTKEHKRRSVTYSTSTEDDNGTFSHGYRMKALFPIYALLICLHRIV